MQIDLVKDQLIEHCLENVVNEGGAYRFFNEGIYRMN